VHDLPNLHVTIQAALTSAEVVRGSGRGQAGMGLGWVPGGKL